MFSASQSDREVLIFEQPFAYKSRGRQMRRLLASHGTVALTPPDALAQPHWSITAVPCGVTVS